MSIIKIERPFYANSECITVYLVYRWKKKQFIHTIPSDWIVNEDMWNNNILMKVLIKVFDITYAWYPVTLREINK